jgi:hypothetical protein
MRFSSLTLALGLGLSLLACVRAPLEMNSECGAGEELCGSACVPAGTCGPGAGGGGGGGGSAGGATSASSLDCTDVADFQTKMSVQYDGRMVNVTGKDKQYYVHTNWWYRFDKQTVTVDGLSYTIGNSANARSNSDNPMGYPSFHIGSYSGHTPTGSNLPKAVSALTQIPTVMVTNAKSKGDSDYNAAYDVWFTATGDPLPSTQYSPGPGGAYLMVWLFKPSDRQPRGRVDPGNGDHKVPGLPGTWDVWIDDTNPACISYVSTTPLESLEFDLNDFINDSVKNGYGVTKDMYLSVIFGGFEVWGGNDGLALKKFCADVK